MNDEGGDRDDGARGDQPPDGERDLLLRSLRKVLRRRGYAGAAIDAKIAELQQRDFPRLTAILRARR